MSLPLTVSCFTKILIGLPFWYQLTLYSQTKGLQIRVCVCVYISTVCLLCYWCDYPGVCDCCACYSNRPEKRFAFKDARLPPKPAGRGVEFKTGDQVEVTRRRLLWVFILRVAVKKSLTNAKLLGRLAAQKFWHAPLGLCSAIYGAREWTCGKKFPISCTRDSISWEPDNISFPRDNISCAREAILCVWDGKFFPHVPSGASLCLLCFDAVGWAAGMASGLWVGCWRGYLSGARCKLAYVPADATATHCLLLQ